MKIEKTHPKLFLALKIFFGILGIISLVNLIDILPVVTQQEVLDNGFSQGVVTFIEPFFFLGFIALGLSFWHQKWKKAYRGVYIVCFSYLFLILAALISIV